MAQQNPNMPEAGRTMRRLALRASIEISARELRKAGDIAVALLRGRDMFLPWTPNLTADDMVEATSFARSLGLTPVPHLVARRLDSEAAARNLLARLSAAGAESILLVGGDVDVPAGPFQTSFDVLRSGMVQAGGFRKIGVTGYPEGHPAMDDGIIQQNLQLKLDYARREGLEVFIVSQFCFDGSVIVEWAKRLWAGGVTAKIRAGVAGPTNLAKLLEMGLRCGVGNSLRALKGRLGSVARLVAPHEPQDVMEDIAAACLAGPTTDALSVHVFAFGGAAMTAQWMERIAPGSIELDSAREGVRAGR